MNGSDPVQAHRSCRCGTQSSTDSQVKGMTTGYLPVITEMQLKVTEM